MSATQGFLATRTATNMTGNELQQKKGKITFNDQNKGEYVDYSKLYSMFALIYNKLDDYFNQMNDNYNII